MMSGRVKFYDIEKGYGFIGAEDGKKYFVHYSAITNGKRLYRGKRVTFDVGERNGKTVATNVTIIRAPKKEVVEQ